MEYKNYGLLQKIEINSRRHKNFFYYNTHNTDLHELTKFAVYMQLRKLGYDVWVEAKLTQNKGIPDIIAMKDNKGIIIEILNTEVIKLGKKPNPKKLKYPSEFEFIEIKASRAGLEQDLEKLYDRLEAL